MEKRGSPGPRLPGTRPPPGSQPRAVGADARAEAGSLDQAVVGFSVESLVSSCFLFSLLIKMRSVYIVREQTEPWLVFHVETGLVYFWLFLHVPGSYRFNPLWNRGRVYQDAGGGEGRHSPPLISLESLLCLPAGLPPLPDLPQAVQLPFYP